MACRSASSAPVKTPDGRGAGVEHLLRDVKDSSVGSLASEVGRMTTGLGGLRARLAEVQAYLQLVAGGQLPVNHDVMYDLQARRPPRPPPRPAPPLALPHAPDLRPQTAAPQMSYYAGRGSLSLCAWDGRLVRTLLRRLAASRRIPSDGSGAASARQLSGKAALSVANTVSCSPSTLRMDF